MGVTFILSGLRKWPGVKFTTLPVENPVGAYFQAMHDTGFYWNSIGYFQIGVGLLMMPVTVNIFLVSVSLHMTGTPFITAAMLLGNAFLLYWHFPNYRGIFQKPL